MVDGIGQVWWEGGFRAGWSCSLPDCLPGFIRPDPGVGESGGYSVLQVGAGPNSGVRYVGAASFYSSRGSRLHPQLESNSSTAWTSSDSGQQGCSPFRWYDMNNCMGSNASQSLIDGIMAHEGSGSGGGNGHQAFWVAEAGKPNYDPWRQVESITGASDTEVHTQVATAVTTAQGSLKSAVCAKGEPTGNLPTGQFWFYSGVNNDFRPRAITEGGHSCS